MSNADEVQYICQLDAPYLCLSTGFDLYFKSLRPWLRPEDCKNKRRKSKANCRNVWFNEFWSQAFNCTFDARNVGVKRCTGKEKLNKYRQEGLVPFVGKSSLFFLLSKWRLNRCVYMLRPIIHQIGFTLSAKCSFPTRFFSPQSTIQPSKHIKLCKRWFSVLYYRMLSFNVI